MMTPELERQARELLKHSPMPDGPLEDFVRAYAGKPMRVEPFGRGYRPVDDDPHAHARVSDRWPLTAEERYRRDWAAAERAASGVDDDRRESWIVWSVVGALALVCGAFGLWVGLTW